jgi:carbonic anhydrase
MNVAAAWVRALEFLVVADLFGVVRCARWQHAAQTVSVEASEINPAYFDYMRYGVEWMSGSCESRGHQSPIDFSASELEEEELGDALEFEYKRIDQPFEITNDGRVLSAHFHGMGYGGVRYNKEIYNLARMDVHMRSEHTIDGKHKPLELQMVHFKDDRSELPLIISVLFDCANPPALLQANPPALLAKMRSLLPGVSSFLQRRNASNASAAPAAPPAAAPAPAGPAPAGPPLVFPSPPPPIDPNLWIPPDSAEPGWSQTLQHFLLVEPPVPVKDATINVSGVPGHVIAPAHESPPIDINAMLTGGVMYSYLGSQTQPPCKEIVRWVVMKDPLTASNTQIKMLHDVIFKMTHWYGNYRATMPINDRKIEKINAVLTPRPTAAPAVQFPLGTYLKPRDSPAAKVAEEAKRIADEATAHMVDLNRRMKNAAEMHANRISPDIWSRTMDGLPGKPNRGLDMEKMAKIHADFTDTVLGHGYDSVEQRVKASIPNGTAMATDIANQIKVVMDYKTQVQVAISTFNYLKKVEDARAKVLEVHMHNAKVEMDEANKTWEAAQLNCSNVTDSDDSLNMTNVTEGFEQCKTRGGKECAPVQFAEHKLEIAGHKMAAACSNETHEYTNTTACHLEECIVFRAKMHLEFEKRAKEYGMAKSDFEGGVEAATKAAISAANAEAQKDS